ncbi:hypothetical protein BDV59DRAFT_43391 [Aspergillus ambiguus]|uniref:uncharacterized protein n=1 Tax=Aspergillus ambiguus TaxID=176160 RepID=UPI003CCD5AAE
MMDMAVLTGCGESDMEGGVVYTVLRTMFGVHFLSWIQTFILVSTLCYTILGGDATLCWGGPIADR